MITTIKLINTFITAHNYPPPFYWWLEHLRSTVFANFKVYNTVLLAIVTVLYIKSPELITESLYPLANISVSLSPVNAHSTLFLYVQLYLDPTCK